MPVFRAGISTFPADTFINNTSGLITIGILISKLTKYPDVGRIIYNRSRSVKSPVVELVNVIILQLITSGIIRIDINEEEKCYCRLVVDSLRLIYGQD